MAKGSDLLTDEFIIFSKKIEQIFEKKKAKKLELKAFYDKINVDLKALDEEAVAAQLEFEKGRDLVPTFPAFEETDETKLIES